MDGSGGESHRKRLSRSWFPVKLFESLVQWADVKEITNGWLLGRRWKYPLHRY